VAVLSMSKQEFSRLDVLLRVQSGRLRVSDACVLIGLQRRQDGDGGVCYIETHDHDTYSGHFRLRLIRFTPTRFASGRRE
jgi:hypothetical protein